MEEEVLTQHRQALALALELASEMVTQSFLLLYHPSSLWPPGWPEGQLV